MTEIPRTKLHGINFNDVALSLAFIGCDSDSNIENLQPMNEGPQQLVKVVEVVGGDCDGAYVFELHMGQ